MLDYGKITKLHKAIQGKPFSLVDPDWILYNDFALTLAAQYNIFPTTTTDASATVTPPAPPAPPPPAPKLPSVAKPNDVITVDWGDKGLQILNFEHAGVKNAIDAISSIMYLGKTPISISFASQMASKKVSGSTASGQVNIKKGTIQIGSNLPSGHASTVTIHEIGHIVFNGGAITNNPDGSGLLSDPALQPFWEGVLQTSTGKYEGLIKGTTTSADKYKTYAAKPKELTANLYEQYIALKVYDKVYANTASTSSAADAPAYVSWKKANAGQPQSEGLTHWNEADFRKHIMPRMDELFEKKGLLLQGSGVTAPPGVVNTPTPTVAPVLPTVQPTMQPTASASTFNTLEFIVQMDTIKNSASPSEQKKLTTFINKINKLYDQKKSHAISTEQFNMEVKDLATGGGTKYMSPGTQWKIIKAHSDNMIKNTVVAAPTIAPAVSNPVPTPSITGQGQAATTGSVIKPVTPTKIPPGTKVVVTPKAGDTMDDIKLKHAALDAQMANGDISKTWYYKANKKLVDFVAQGNALPSPMAAGSSSTITQSYALKTFEPLGMAPSAKMDWDQKNKELTKVVNSATDGIDLIHGFPWDDPGTSGLNWVQQTPGAGGVQGTVYGSYKYNPNGWATATVDPNGPYPEFTVVHEVGHHLYYKINDIDSSVMKPVFEALYKTTAHKTLTAQANGTPMPGMKTNNVAKYLTTHDELFSRAYAQYIALRSGNVPLMTQLQSQQSSTIPVQWDNKDFEVVLAAFDEMFVELDWKAP